jgi:hypothetical protein
MKSLAMKQFQPEEVEEAKRITKKWTALLARKEPY